MIYSERIHTQEYFLGTAVFQKTAEPSDYDIVDGQQRFTSLMILLACLRDLIEDERFSAGLHEKIVQEENEVDSIPEKIRLTVKDHDIYNQIVVTEGGTLDLSKVQGLSEPESRYVLAVETFSDRLEDLSQDDLKAFAQFLSQKCILVTLSTTSFEEAFRLFTIVNDRGKQLRRIDVLKAQNLSPEHIANKALREKLANTWETYENDIGEDRFESIINILRLVILKDKPQFDLLREYKERIFDKKLLLPGQPFIAKLFEYIDLYEAIFIDMDYCDTNEENRAYRSLMYIMDAEFKASEWRGALLLFASKFGPVRFFDFVQEIEKYYLSHFLGGMRKDERYAEYAKLLALVEAAKTPQAAIDLVEYDEDGIVEVVTAPIMYGRAYTKYVLLRLELATCELDRVHRFSARSIEHVFPQNPDDDSEWAEKEGADNPIEFVHSVGNLVLLSKGKNSSAGNLDFDEKKEKYLKKRVSDYPRSIEVLGYEDWNTEVIEERTREAGEKILEFLD
ncbi:MAG: hypothetical protein QOH04_865 [Sphingomonadales bacterium]|jgi:hypothetical protein|nr:hypothetical protein [Sphingomonadales bacterium]